MSPSHTASQPTFLLITCEHGGCDVPAKYEHLFHGQSSVLESHRGHDIGALGVALRLASNLAAPVVFSTVTRLLVDLNRSVDQPDLFSEFTRGLPREERERIVATFYTPHRRNVEQLASCAITSGYRVLHLGVHSCADVLNGNRRDLDIALLFDEARALEQAFCEQYRAQLQQRQHDLRHPFNQPYRGADDGLTTTLRSRFRAEDYLGIEIELRQGMILSAAEQRAVGDLLSVALRDMAGVME